MEAIIINSNYQGKVAGTLTINQAKATITFDAKTLTQVYTGKARKVTATTYPDKLDYIATYTGVGSTAYGPSSTPPKGVGMYDLAVEIKDDNYQGEAAGNLAVHKRVIFVSLLFSALGTITSSYAFFFLPWINTKSLIDFIRSNPKITLNQQDIQILIRLTQHAPTGAELATLWTSMPIAFQIFLVISWLLSVLLGIVLSLLIKVKLSYIPEGSTSGEDDLLNSGIVDFAGTEEAVSDNQEAQIKRKECSPIPHIPIVVGAVGIIYNLPSAP